MKSFRIFACAAALITLTSAGCAPIQSGAEWVNNQFTSGSAPQANSVAAAEQLYTAADKGLTASIQQGVFTSASTVATIQSLDNKVYAALVSLRQAAEPCPGTTPTPGQPTQPCNSIAIPALLAAYNAAYSNLYTTAHSSGVTVPTS